MFTAGSVWCLVIVVMCWRGCFCRAIRRRQSVSDAHSAARAIGRVGLFEGVGISCRLAKRQSHETPGTHTWLCGWLSEPHVRGAPLPLGPAFNSPRGARNYHYYTLLFSRHFLWGAFGANIHDELFVTEALSPKRTYHPQPNSSERGERPKPKQNTHHEIARYGSPIAQSVYPSPAAQHQQRDERPKTKQDVAPSRRPAIVIVDGQPAHGLLVFTAQTLR